MSMQIKRLELLCQERPVKSYLGDMSRLRSHFHAQWRITY